ncbi:hypothetical protein N624_0282 [Levilactobacillus brevis]|nr:hypothetical protein N624_0282 [Levilactobacillus brevis]
MFEIEAFKRRYRLIFKEKLEGHLTLVGGVPHPQASLDNQVKSGGDSAFH